MPDDDGYFFEGYTSCNDWIFGGFTLSTHCHFLCNTGNAQTQRFFIILKTEEMKKKGYANEYIVHESICNYIHKYY